MEANNLKQKLKESLDAVRLQTDLTPQIGFILGSGLGEFANSVQNAVRIPYENIPFFKVPKVAGHSGELVLGKIKNTSVAVLKGRIHYYEGHPIDEVVYPVRLLFSLGIKNLFVTNAAGGILNMRVPGFMIIRDHINLTGLNPLIGPNDNSMGQRFPDMSNAYDKILTKNLESICKKLKVNFKKGIYAGLTGPTYETPAEVQYLKRIGAHAIGMSTVNEVIVARHLGIKCVGLSCITNPAAGIQKTPLRHEEVTGNAKKIQKQFTAILTEFTALGLA